MLHLLDWHVSRGDFRQNAIVLAYDQCPNNRDPPPDPNGLGSRGNSPAELIGQHDRVQVDAYEECLFTGLFSPIMIGHTRGEIVRKRDNHATVDIPGRVLVVVFDIDDSDVKIGVGSSLHSNVLIEGHGFGPGWVQIKGQFTYLSLPSS